jgi:hypothetical protein
MAVGGGKAAKAAYILNEGVDSFANLSKELGQAHANCFAKECAVTIKEVGPQMMLRR